jgi:hypothetical protein
LLWVEVAAQSFDAELIIELTLVIVREHLVGRSYLLEALLGTLVSGIHVGVIFARASGTVS